MSSKYYYRHQQPPPPPLGPDIPPQLLVTLVCVPVLLVYWAVYSLGVAPSPISIMLSSVGLLFGQGAKERVASLFAQANPAFVATRVRRRAASMVGIELSDGEGLVGGLYNLGNTCYQNSVLQAMASLPALVPYLRALEEEDDTEANTSTELSWLFHFLNTISRQPQVDSPPSVLTKFNASGWGYNEQQDAQEYMQGLMGSLEREAEEAAKRRKDGAVKGLEGVLTPPDSQESQTDDELRSPFEGLYAQRVGCLQCGYVESISLIPFNTLSLPIPPGHEVYLEDCLGEYTVIEEINNVDCDKCTLLKVRKMLQRIVNSDVTNPRIRETSMKRLDAVDEALENDIFTPDLEGVKLDGAFKVSTTKTKQMMLCRTPPVLVLHTNRSLFSGPSGYISKNYANVIFPKYLDLQALRVVTNHNNLNMNPSVSMSTSKDEGERVVYELRSLVCHQGGHHNGHYTTYRFAHGRWWDISDNNVYQCSEDQVFHAPNAFLLFYERLSSSEIPENFTGTSHIPAAYNTSDKPPTSLYQEMGMLSALSRSESEDGVLVTAPLSPPETPKQLPTPPMSEPEVISPLDSPEEGVKQLETPPPDTPREISPQPVEDAEANATGTSPKAKAKRRNRKRGGKGKQKSPQPQAVAVN